jgi:hypothetical protein
LLNIMLTDEFWYMTTSGNQLALHFGVGPHNAVLCLLMAGLLIYGLASGANYTTSMNEHELLSDNAFAATCAAAAISLLATLVACCQLVGWVATFGELLCVDLYMPLGRP